MPSSLSFAALAILAVVPHGSLAQSGSRTVEADTSMMTAILRTAVREALYTAHGADTPQLVCVGLQASGPPSADWLARLADPPKSAIDELQDGRSVLVRPRSACRRVPPGTAQRHTSLIEDTLTRKRGILVWVRKPEASSGGTYAVEFGYDQHELSGGSWKCTIRRRAAGWEVAACKLLGIA